MARVVQLLIALTRSQAETASMLYPIIKVALSALIIVAVSEVSKRSTFVGGLLASLPLVSLLAMIWLYVDTRDASRVAELSRSIFWLVLPSLALFIALPLLLKRTSLGFALSLAASTAIMLAAYGLMVVGLHRLGIRL